MPGPDAVGGLFEGAVEPRHDQYDPDDEAKAAVARVGGQPWAGTVRC